MASFITTASFSQSAWKENINWNNYEVQRMNESTRDEQGFKSVRNIGSELFSLKYKLKLQDRLSNAIETLL